MRGRTLALVLIVGLGLVGVIWRSASGNDAKPAPAAGPASTAGLRAEAASGELSAVLAALEEERVARRALAAEVASLRAEVAKLSAGTAAAPAATTALPPGHPGAPPADRAAPEFDEKALLDAGFSEREARQLRQRMESQELEQLYLRDRAVREGWAASPRFVQESRALDAKGKALRDELGDDQYDWVLYASGQSNRVVVQSVLDGSPAGTADIRPGDAIVSYGDARLFDAGALRDATTGGQAGETVPVEVSREGETLRVFVPRGPLGVRLEESRIRPSAPARG